jgi:hypothetical protein
LWTTVLFSFTDKFNCNHVLFTFHKHLLPFNTSNPLCLANRWDWQPHCKLERTLVVLCAGSTLLLMSIVRPATSQPATPSEVTSFSYWSIKPWFCSEGKLVVVLIPPSFGVLQQRVRIWWAHAIKLFFCCRCRGERRFLQGESLISNIFTLL